MSMPTQTFDAEFRSLEYIILKAKRVLLFAHTRPDPDTVGANLALAEYVRSCGKHVDIACFDAFPDALKSLAEDTFFHPDQLDLSQYDAVIVCDSVDRGFHKIAPSLPASQAVVLIDHHPDITTKGDVVIIDTGYSSSSELVYLFFSAIKIKITPSMATTLLMGILFDTGGFQHSNVSPRVMEIASDLMKKGAPLSKIAKIIFTNNTMGALKLWGRAFEKARFNQKNGMLVTGITTKDIAECHAAAEDIHQVASILSAVPDARFALVLSEHADNTIRASLRSTKHQGTDVSAIAHRFGGGGHKLASGFEIQGRLIETNEGFMVA
ncbi:MAG TPA: bifunctional oligoribonuclease/PAP phosphatase NrnA [Patescibacteria group bacterium]|nr:bifunctional oligoribonuclease/PAP phosphatase NrnA [Patescibacteria group bacterium]